MNIILATHSLGGIPQKLHETESLDVSNMMSRMRHAGHGVTAVTHAQLMSMAPADIAGRAILYASSQYPELFQCIEDCLLYAEACGGHLIPSFPLFRSHENKFFQELVKKRLGLDVPGSRLICTMEDLHECLRELDFPLVFKTSKGFGSSGVFLVRSAGELIAATQAALTPIHPRASSVIHRLRTWRSHRNTVERYRSNYPLLSGRIVLQELLAGLTHDWKVLVFGGTCFCLKRFVRPNDFRASGSGNFRFDAEPSHALLDFALDVVHRLDTPWASLDIAEATDGYKLIEYQCVHFGLYTLMRNTRCYTKQDSVWISRSVESPTPEDYFCDAMIQYLQRFPNTDC